MIPVKLTFDFVKDNKDFIPEVQEFKSENYKKILVTHGANQGEFDFIDMTIYSARVMLKEVFNIPDYAFAYVDGKKVKDESLLLKPGANLEFMKTEGVKG